MSVTGWTISMTIHSALLSMPSAKQQELLTKLEAESSRRRRTNRLRFCRPSGKQREVHDKGAEFRERLFVAANQVGKTLSGAAEVGMHLTGQYPDWWTGRRFDHPVIWIAGSESAEL